VPIGTNRPCSYDNVLFNLIYRGTYTVIRKASVNRPEHWKDGTYPERLARDWHKVVSTHWAGIVPFRRVRPVPRCHRAVGPGAVGPGSRRALS
jgi:hypothetical protein